MANSLDSIFTSIGPQRYRSIGSKKRKPEDVLSMLKKKCKLQVRGGNFIKDKLGSPDSAPAPLTMKDFNRMLEDDPQSVFAGTNGMRFLLSDVSEFISRWCAGDEPGQYRTFESFADYRFWYMHSQLKDRGRGPDNFTSKLLEESIPMALAKFPEESVELIFASGAPAMYLTESSSTVSFPESSGITLVARAGNRDWMSYMFQTRGLTHLLQKSLTPNNPYFMTFSSDLVPARLFAPYLSVFIESDDHNGAASLASPLSEAAVRNCLETKPNISLGSSHQILADALRSVVRSMDALN